MAQLPTPGGDEGTWGTILNDFLEVAHNPDGTLKSNAVTKANVGLANVDNTSDANKPISAAAQTALDSKLSISGGTLTGDVTSKDGSLLLTESTGNDTYIQQSVVGKDSGVASLDSSGQVPLDQLGNAPSENDRPLIIGLGMPGAGTVRSSTIPYIMPAAGSITGFQATVASGSGTVVQVTQNGTAIGSGSGSLSTTPVSITFSAVSFNRGDLLGLNITTAGSASDVTVSVDGKFT